VNDLLIAAGVIGSRNLTDIPRCADLFSRLGARLAGEPEQEQSPRYHFGYPGSTHGFQSEDDRGAAPALRQVAGERFTNGGALQISLRGLNKKGECRVFVPTYLRPAALSANNYQASFSPAIWPGQTIRARLLLPPDAPAGLLVAPFAWDDHAETQHQPPATALQPGEWHDISFRVPPLHNALLSRAGLVLRTLGPPWDGRVLLDWLDWDGAPEWSSDFSRDRAEYDAASGWTFLRGFWRLEGGAYHGSGVGLSESYTGDVSWRDLSLSVDLVPLAGAHHHVLVRVQGARRSYVVGLAGNGRLAIYKNAGGYHEVAAAPCAWTHGQRVRLAVTAAGAELAVAVDGQPLLSWRDEDAPYLSGQVGLGNGPACHTRFERVEMRSID
jgi:hypothetical protein